MYMSWLAGLSRSGYLFPSSSFISSPLIRFYSPTWQTDGNLEQAEQASTEILAGVEVIAFVPLASPGLVRRCFPPPRHTPQTQRSGSASPPPVAFSVPILAFAPSCAAALLHPTDERHFDNSNLFQIGWHVARAPFHLFQKIPHSGPQGCRAKKQAAPISPQEQGRTGCEVSGFVRGPRRSRSRLLSSPSGRFAGPGERHARLLFFLFLPASLSLPLLLSPTMPSVIPKS